ncbi:uncharacterized protein LOC128556342 isoform X2 [Mercenaria mercenaria]|uniref:uncharacterized protein LOC128556342 isoform X2 n=1 Tax=Mercenaria mercenaria TaxID=6596 RepID=UPI00234F4D5E|nr:uncharacterized protein LOC128556342 isoform X2 [Mercenaria mercenaria]
MACNHPQDRHNVSNKMEKSIKQAINLNIVMFLSLMRLSDSSDIGCSPPWEQVYQSCVRFMKSKPYHNWHEARSSCRSINADLLSITDEQKSIEIDLWLTNHTESTEPLKWWIGLRAVRDTWRWVDNNEIFSMWPNTGAVNKCGLLDYQGIISRADCITERIDLLYICEIKKITTTKITSASTITQTTKPMIEAVAIAFTRITWRTKTTSSSATIKTMTETTKEITIETTSDLLSGDTCKCNVVMYVSIPVTVGIVGIIAVVILFVWKRAGRIHKNTSRKDADNEVELSHVSVRIYDQCLAPQEASNQGNSNYITPVASIFDRRPGNAEYLNKKQESSADSRDKDVTAQSVNLNMFTTAHNAERAEYNYQQLDREETTGKHVYHTVERHVYHTVE